MVWVAQLSSVLGFGLSARSLWPSLLTGQLSSSHSHYNATCCSMPEDALPTKCVIRIIYWKEVGPIYLVENILPISASIPNFCSLFLVRACIRPSKEGILLHQLLEEHLFCRSMDRYNGIFWPLLSCQVRVLAFGVKWMLIALNISCYTYRIRDRKYSNFLACWNI